MRVLLLLSLASVALAADDAFDLLAAAGAAPEVLWSAHELESNRFFDSDLVGPRFPRAVPLEVVVRNDDRVRVYYNGTFGWVDEAKVSSTPPASAFGEIISNTPIDVGDSPSDDEE